MSDPKGPWDLEPDPSPAPPPRAQHPYRFWIWLGAIAVVLSGVWGLTQLFPNAVSGREGWSNVAYGVGLLVLVSAGVFRARFNLGQSARHLAIWVGLLAILVVGYSFRSDLGGVWTRVRSEFAPGYAVQTGPREMVVTQEEGDSFVLIGQVNGQTVRFLLDTGASDIVLRPGDARRLGVDVDHTAFTREIETANGQGRSAPFTAQTLSVGKLTLNNVPMSINATPMSSSLLGMSFLKRLESYQVKEGKLYLRWRG